MKRIPSETFIRHITEQNIDKYQELTAEKLSVDCKIYLAHDFVYVFKTRSK